MFRSYVLQPSTAHDVPLEFSWDSEAGELDGPGAEIVRNMCRHAVRAGYVHGHPYPTAFDIIDPLHRPAEMAVVLGQFWALDEELAGVYPSSPGDFDHGAGDSSFGEITH